ncbi:MAG: GAF domain-containing protein, partial [bacterium]|nr:GAF domain-containing protein [bacterium]
MLGQLGLATQVSRVYVFENHAGSAVEWVAPDIDSRMGKPDPTKTEGFERWVEMMSRGEPVHGPVAEFPSAEFGILNQHDIRSLAAAPVFRGDCWWGFIGFDDCRTPRRWSVSELGALTAAAGILGAAIERAAAQGEENVAHERDFISAVVETVRALVVVLDSDGRIVRFN